MINERNFWQEYFLVVSLNAGEVARMRWLWRIAVLLLLITLVRGLMPAKPQAFIIWPEQNAWVQKLNSEVRRFQAELQDLPASIEVEIRRFWRDVQTGATGREV